MNKILVEICCGSADDVIQSYKAGADRVELNTDLFHGGLTATVGQLKVAKAETNNDIPVMAMVRPRQAGFNYTDIEFKTAVEDAKALIRNGADGLVFGFLNDDGTINIERTKALREITGNKQAVFHRAIDVVPDWKKALDILIDLEFTRVLTSGQESNAFMGAETIREMLEYADGRIEILPGAGIKLKNMDRIIRETGCNQIHMSAHSQRCDNSTRNTSGIFYGGALYPPEDSFNMIDADTVRAVTEKLK